MRVLSCPCCRGTVSFEDGRCAECAALLGFDRTAAVFVAIDGAADGCANRAAIDCNWLPADGPGTLCGSCALTRTRPADTDTAAVPAWRAAERAKRRLLVQLDALHLPLRSSGDDPTALVFDLLSSSRKPVTTGHAGGVITIDLAEGDDLHRESQRLRFGEPYRTLLGHLRHEVGHFYWLVLVRDTGWLDRFRQLFGDERESYRDALRTHYARGGDDRSWAETHVTRYAAAHPWEDWAENFAQYLHIQDTLDTAAAWAVHPAGPVPEKFDEVMARWVPLARALNALNHSMGRADFYPFTWNARTLEKLELVHDVLLEHDLRSAR